MSEEIEVGSNWVNLHEESGMSAGAPLTIQNKGIFPMLVMTSNEAPTSSTAGFRTRPGETWSSDLGDTVWARSESGSTSVYLQELKALTGSSSNKIRTNVLTKSVFGLYKTFVADTDLTIQTTLELESEFVGLRIAVPNLSDAAVNGVKVSISLGTDQSAGNWLNDPIPKGSTGFLPLKQNGQVSATLAPRISETVPSLNFFDFVGLRSLPRDGETRRPILAVRIEFPNGSVVTAPMNDVYYWRVDGDHRTMRCSKQAVLGCTNAPAFTTTAAVDENVCVPIVQYTTVKQGTQVMASGDSTVEGIGAQTRCFGAVPRASIMASTPDAPVEYFNAGMFGKGPVVYSVGAAYYAKIVKPSAIFYSPYSINNTPAGGLAAAPWALDEDYAGIATVMNGLNELPRPPQLIFLEGLPCDVEFRDTGAGDQMRVDLNVWLKNFNGAKVVAGYADAFTGDTLPNGQRLIKAGLSDDHCHPNDSGYTILGNLIKPFIKSL